MARKPILPLAVLFLSLAAASAQAEPAAGLAIRLTPGVGLAVFPDDVSGGMERATSLDVEYSIFQLPILTVGAGASYSRASLEDDGSSVVSKVVGHGEVQAIVSSSPTVDVSIYVRAGGYRLASDDRLFDGRSGAAMSGGLRFGQSWPRAPAVRLALDVGYTRNYNFRNYVFFGSAISVRLLKPRPIDLEDLWTDEIFPVLGSYYASNPFGTVVVRNRDSVAIEDVVVSVAVDRLMEEPWTCAEIPVLAPGQAVAVELFGLLGDTALAVTSDTEVALRVNVGYRSKNEERTAQTSGSLLVRGRNAITWEDDRRVAAFVTTADAEVLRLARNAVAWGADPAVDAIDLAIQKAIAVHRAVGDLGISYVVDPASSYASLSATRGAVDFVQFPRQTLVNRAGDCDDLSVLYAALLEAVGVEAAFITVPGHIFVAAALDKPEAVGRDDGRYIRDAGRLWIPLETTLAGEPFVDAWEAGVRQWTDALPGAALLPLADARAVYRAPDIVVDERTVEPPHPDAFLEGFLRDRTAVARAFVATSGAALSARFERTRRAADANRLGVLYARHGLYDEARERFLDAIDLGDEAEAWENLGSLAVLTGDHEFAATCFQMALEREPESAGSRLGLARVDYELGRYGAAADAFALLSQASPRIAIEHGYLADGDGRRAAEIRRSRPTWRE